LTFSQLRQGDSGGDSSALVSLFLSLCPERVPNGPRMDDLKGRRADTVPLGKGLEPAQRIDLPTHRGPLQTPM
jgi:hypothetical protein